MMVALKELNNSKNITPEELNELKIFYDFAIRHQNSSIMYEYTDSYYDFNHYHDIKSTRSLESIDSEISNNKFEDNLTINDNDYLTKEIELDIDNDTSFSDSKDDDYVTEEINFDI
ncbi:unnamed protein product [Rhizophagus irregularis]|nr:unnamed protein product [Rhizophagus irregularis]